MKKIFLLIIYITIFCGKAKAQGMSAKKMEESIDVLASEVKNIKKSITNSTSRKSVNKRRIIENRKFILEVDESEEGYIGLPHNNISKNSILINGSVMCMAKNGENYEMSREMYDKKVIGILTEYTLEKSGKKKYFIAISGKVRVRVGCPIGENCDIEVGDLLVASDEWGVATKCKDKNQCIGAIVGKALEPYHNRSREGFIMALITLK